MSSRAIMLRRWWFIVVLSIGILCSGCGTVRDIMHIQTPKLKFHEAYLTGVSFDAAELGVDVEVSNPNSLAIDLVGFDYELIVNDTSFLAGQADRQVTIAARQTSEVRIPVTVKYQKLYDTLKELVKFDDLAYQIAGGVRFDLPVLGATRIPFKKEGVLPMVKVPTLDLHTLRINRLELTGADLELEFRLHNPNAFDLLLNSLTYEFAVNGQTWAKGVSPEAVRIARKGTSSFGIPIALDFGQIGLTIYRALTGKPTLNYQIQGSLDLGTSFALLKHATVPFEGAGKVTIVR